MMDGWMDGFIIYSKGRGNVWKSKVNGQRQITLASSTLVNRGFIAPKPSKIPPTLMLDPVNAVEMRPSTNFSKISWLSECLGYNIWHSHPPLVSWHLSS